MYSIMYEHPGHQFTYYEQKILPATKIFMTSAKAAKASLLTEIKKLILFRIQNSIILAL